MLYVTRLAYLVFDSVHSLLHQTSDRIFHPKKIEKEGRGGGEGGTANPPQSYMPSQLYTCKKLPKRNTPNRTNHPHEPNELSSSSLTYAALNCARVLSRPLLLLLSLSATLKICAPSLSISVLSLTEKAALDTVDAVSE